MNLPQDITTKIENRWFYLYKYVSYKDLINLLKFELLRVLVFFWKYIFIIMLVFSISIIPFLNNVFYLKYYLLFFIFFWSLLFLYLLILSIKYTFNIIKNSLIIISDKYIVISEKSIKINDYKNIDLEIINLENKLKKPIFSQNINKASFKDLQDEIKNWYEKIYQKKIWSIIFLLYAFYIFYALIISFLYFLWTIFIFFIWWFFWIITKFILKYLWNEIIFINDSFEKIEKLSNSIEKENIYIKNIFEKIILKDQDISSINNKLIPINKLISKSIEINNSLKNKILYWKYKDIYNFSIYENWLKLNLLKPLLYLENILKNYLENIDNSIKELEKLLTNENIKNKESINLQLVRLESIKNSIYLNIKNIENYIKLLA